MIWSYLEGYVMWKELKYSLNPDHSSLAGWFSHCSSIEFEIGSKRDRQWLRKREVKKLTSHWCYRSSCWSKVEKLHEAFFRLHILHVKSGLCHITIPTCGVSSKHWESHRVEISLHPAIDASPCCWQGHTETQIICLERWQTNSGDQIWISRTTFLSS